MSDYDLLISRVGKAAVNRLVSAGLFDDDLTFGSPRSSSKEAAARSNEDGDKSAAREKRRTAGQLANLPHVIPYQGSKRSLAPTIAKFVPGDIDRWYEPFAGSAAMTILASSRNLAESYIIADVLAPLAELWRLIIAHPEHTSRRYAEIWNLQRTSDAQYFYLIRDRYNSSRDPVDLLYLVCRCVKNAVRFGKRGDFTQSVDKRRLGTKPEKMTAAMFAISELLSGKCEIRTGDWTETTADAGVNDFLYMDPPYLGTTEGRDKRYAEQLQRDRLVGGLESLLARRVRFTLSYDGMTGDKVYADPLPNSLGLARILLHAGRSSQSTLIGRSEETIESLYLSPGLAQDSYRLIQGPHAQSHSDLALAS